MNSCIPEQPNLAPIIVMVGEPDVGKHVMLNELMSKWKFEFGMYFGHDLSYEFPKCTHRKELNESFFDGYISALQLTGATDSYPRQPSNYIIIDEANAACLESEYFRKFVACHRSISNTTIIILVQALSLTSTPRSAHFIRNTNIVFMWPTSIRTDVKNLYRAFGYEFSQSLSAFKKELNECRCLVYQRC